MLAIPHIVDIRSSPCERVTGNAPLARTDLLHILWIDVWTFCKD